MDALEAGDRVSELEMERGLTLGTALAAVPSYMADLDEELEHCRALYTLAVVTEIATLRAKLFGTQTG